LRSPFATIFSPYFAISVVVIDDTVSPLTVRAIQAEPNRYTADAGLAGVGRNGTESKPKPIGIIMAAPRPDSDRRVELAGLEPATSWVR
jgi:hypothetical protein